MADFQCPTLASIETFLRAAYGPAEKDGPPPTVRARDGQVYPFDPARVTLLSEILSFALQNVEVQPSPIHGRGLFARQDFKSGELLTFYPADVIEYRPKGADGPTFPVPSARELAQRPQEGTLFREAPYRLFLDEHYSIIGDPIFDNPRAYLGHFINDAQKCQPGPEGVAAYLRDSLAAANCKFHSIDGLHVAVLATRDIAAGEEILVSYGVARWLPA